MQWYGQVGLVLSLCLLVNAVVDQTTLTTSTEKVEVIENVDSTTISSQNEKDESPSKRKTSVNEDITGEEEKVTYQNEKLIRVALRNKEDKDFIKSLEENGEVETWLSNATIVDVIVNSKETLKNIEDHQLQYKIVIDNLQRAIDEENPPVPQEDWELLEGRRESGDHRHWSGGGMGKHRKYPRTRLESKKYLPGQRYWTRFHSKRKKQGIRKRRYRLTWQMYHRMADIHSYLDYLAATYPKNVTVTNIGRSVEGRPLQVLKFSSQPQREGNRPAIWVDAGIHAREWITPASLTYIMSQMIEGGDGDKGVDWYFNPLINPDGYEHSHKFARLWRKNRANPERGSCAGIDLNRNFGYKWGGQGASKQPCGETFAGSKAFSEPETAAIEKFINSKQGQIQGYVSLHSYGQYILYPWGYDRKVPTDYQDLERVGREMARAIKDVDGQQYTVGAAANTLYPASGGSDDWAKGSAKIKYAYTLELRDRGNYGFLLPARFIVPTAKEAYAAINVLAKELSSK